MSTAIFPHVYVVRKRVQQGQHLRPGQPAVPDTGEVQMNGRDRMFLAPGKKGERALSNERERCRPGIVNFDLERAQLRGRPAGADQQPILSPVATASSNLPAEGQV